MSFHHCLTLLKIYIKIHIIWIFMPMAFKTFSLIHSLPQPPGDTAVQTAIKRQLILRQNGLLKNVPFIRVSSYGVLDFGISAFSVGYTLTGTLVIRDGQRALCQDLLLLAFSCQESHYVYLQY